MKVIFDDKFILGHMSAWAMVGIIVFILDIATGNLKGIIYVIAGFIFTTIGAINSAINLWHEKNRERK